MVVSEEAKVEETEEVTERGLGALVAEMVAGAWVEEKVVALVAARARAEGGATKAEAVPVVG